MRRRQIYSWTLAALLLTVTAGAAPAAKELVFDAASVGDDLLHVSVKYDAAQKQGHMPGPWQVSAWADGAKVEAKKVQDPVTGDPAIRLTNLEGQSSLMLKPWSEVTAESGKYEVALLYRKGGSASGKLVMNVGGTEYEAPLRPTGDSYATAAIPFELASDDTKLRPTIQLYGGQGVDEALYVRSFTLDRVGDIEKRRPMTVDVSGVTGAQIDESQVQQTLEVGEGQPYPTIRAAWEQADANLKNSIPTRIRIHPGTYREGEFELQSNWQQTGAHPVKDTLLIIEAAQPGTVAIKQSDIFAPETWTAVKGPDGKVLYYEHAWPHDFGFNPGGWGQHNPRLPIEHRSELAFIDGVPLRQVMLEQYDYQPAHYTKKFPEGTTTDSFPGVPQNVNKHGVYTYRGMADPAEALVPGSFGIAERDENGNRIFLKPFEDTKWEDALVEVSTRRHHMWFFWKDNLVLRGLDFLHAAGRIEAHSAVRVGHWIADQKDYGNNNVLIEDCRFLFNNNNQLSIREAKNVTLRNVEASYGAHGGIGTGRILNLLWENVSTNFNNWRVAGGWSSGAAKNHEIFDAIYRNHTSVGNNGHGLWFDITCQNVLVEGALLLDNNAGFDWEISQGVVFRDGLSAWNRKGSAALITGMDMTFENSILYGGDAVGRFHFQASNRTSNQDIPKRLGRDLVTNYTLGPLTITNCIIASADATPLFFQDHGGPALFRSFIEEDVHPRGNIWHADAENREVFGFFKDYSGDWRNRPTRNAMMDWDAWVQRTGATGQWAAPMFVDPANWDFRLQPGSPASGMNLPMAKQVDPKLRQAWLDFKALNIHGESTDVADVQ